MNLVSWTKKKRGFYMSKLTYEDKKTLKLGNKEVILSGDSDGYLFVNNNQFQLHDFSVVNGYLHATGYVFCDVDCPTKAEDVLIKYANNTLNVVSFK